MGAADDLDAASAALRCAGVNALDTGDPVVGDDVDARAVQPAASTGGECGFWIVN